MVKTDLLNDIRFKRCGFCGIIFNTCEEEYWRGRLWSQNKNDGVSYILHKDCLEIVKEEMGIPKHVNPIYHSQCGTCFLYSNEGEEKIINIPLSEYNLLNCGGVGY